MGWARSPCPCMYIKICPIPAITLGYGLQSHAIYRKPFELHLIRMHAISDVHANSTIANKTAG